VTRVALVLWLSVSMACVVPGAPALRPWVGHPVDELVGVWGPPAIVRDVGVGRVLTWEHFVPIGGGYWAERSVTIDARGIIRAYSWRGLW
jgi:hypothetical protein